MSALHAKDIFLDALELPEPQRHAFIQQACAGNSSLLAKVAGFMATHEHASGFLSKPMSVPVALASGAENPWQHDERPGDVIDRYELVRPLGEGGFGMVFLAEQRHPVQRQVALKVIKRGMDSRQIVQRFEAERQTLAVMDHPNIARVFDAGTTRFGRPYFVMEFVAGLPINAYCDEKQLGIRQRLELIERVCLAVQHAHTRGVIHRDLKPGNILVTEVDGQPEPKVIDFGVAKATDPDAAISPAVTHEMQIVGTPQYMSPEQATTDGTRMIDTRSDVYSIGTILYELVAGAPPFDPQALRQAGLERICQIIREESPPKPSTRIADPLTSTQLAETHGAAAQQLRRQIAGEVDWIVMKALEKEPQRRYQSAAEFAADIRRHLEHQAVLAGPPSTFYQVRKFARRHRLQIGAASVVLAALITTAIVATVMATRARKAEAVARANEIKAQTELSRATAISKFTDVLLGGVTPAVARGRDTSLLRELLDRAVVELPKKLDNQPLPNLIICQMAAESIYALGDAKAAAAILEPAYDALAGTPDAEHPERLRAGVTLSTVLEESGQDEKSERVVRESIAGYERAGKGNTESTMSARIALAGVLKKRGRKDEAQKLLKDVVEAYREAGHEDEEVALVAANNLAMSLRQANQIDEAIAIWERLLKVQKAKLGVDHPYTVGTMNNLAASNNAVGRYAEAEAIYREQLVQDRKIYATGHPSLVKTLTNLGSLLVEHGNLEEGIKLLEEAQAMSKNLESIHPARISLGVQLIKLRQKQGRWDEAVELAKWMHDTYIKQYGENDRRSVTCVSFRIRALVGAKRYDEAKALLDATPPELAAQMGVDNRQSFHASAGLLLFAMGDRAAAAEQAVKARSFIQPDSGGRERAASSLLDLESQLAESSPKSAKQPATSRAVGQ